MKKTACLFGPTGVGKSSVAIEFALALKQSNIDLEIINVDSVCFYQEFNIGSAKPSLSEQQGIPHHLFDLVSPIENFDASKFLKHLEPLLLKLQEKNKRALLVGGSGFYLKALRYGMWNAPETNPEIRLKLEQYSSPELYEQLHHHDPDRAKKIGPQDRYRLIRALEIFLLTGQKPSEIEKKQNTTADPRFHFIFLDRKKDELEERLKLRINEMITQGLVEETQHLLHRFPGVKALESVGYREVVHYLLNIKPEGRKITPGISGLKDEILLAHRQLAKAQRTWAKNSPPDQSFQLDEEKPALKAALMKLYQEI